MNKPHMFFKHGRWFCGLRHPRGGLNLFTLYADADPVVAYHQSAAMIASLVSVE